MAASAAVLSFDALAGLGRLCGYGDLAPLLPVVLDAGAAAGSVAWLAPASGEAARRFGRTLALALLAGSVAGNAAAHVLTAYGLTAPWRAVVAVSALPPAILGAVVHLAALAAHAHTPPTIPVREITLPTAGDGSPGASEAGDESPNSDDAAPDDQAQGLIAEGIGRRRLSRELGITEHQARRMLHDARNGRKSPGEHRP